MTNIDRTQPGSSAAEKLDEDPATPRQPRKYVLFADGTGNAFSTQESNVWRLYEALDRTQPDQVAFYIKGVGTAGWAPFAKLDGATGIGVPSNVRKLYRFLCWNWQPGDEIYIFGFSRGAFTARTLAALIATQGLVPAQIDGQPVTHTEMARNAMAAWRAYRGTTVPWYKTLPTIWIARLIRTIVLAFWHFILRHRSYRDVKRKMDGRKDVKITFLGLFDTVEAYGVPVEEIRTAIDWAIWPISFRNYKLSDKVETARHALALDDERTTFHPLRFEHPQGSTRIREVWFTGMHSDVGGGYPDGTLSYVPLVWMAEQLGNALRFQPNQIDDYRAYQSSIGPMHDSRGGAAIMYRYGPRKIGEDVQKDGGPPVVHWSVVERMLHGCDNYAPVTLLASANVLLPDGTVKPLIAESTREAIKAAPQTSGGTPATAAPTTAPMKLAPPDDNMVQQTLDTVWWRRVFYFTLLALVGFVAAWPWIARSVIGLFLEPTEGVRFGGTNALKIITDIDFGLGAVVGSTANFLKSLSPSWLAPWYEIAIYYPFATTLVVLALLFVLRFNGYLRDRIRERARLAWNRPDRKVPNIGRPSVLLKFARFWRLNGRPLRIAFSTFLVPGLFLLLIFSLAAVAAGRSYFNWYAGTGEVCEKTSVTPVTEQPTAAPRGLFDTASPCWASGLAVEQGRKYRIWITIKEPWFDRSIMSGANGFDSSASRHVTALPLRRWVRGAAWFQPVLRVGEYGANEIPLREVNAQNADKLPRQRDGTDGKKVDRPSRLEDTVEFEKSGLTFGNFEKIPEAHLALAQQVWRDQKLTEAMVADFVAPASGEVFLYVNDAVQIFPFLKSLVGPYHLFYGNNRGTAEVKIRLEPLPASP